MNFARLFSALSIVLFLFVSCGKELSLEEGSSGPLPPDPDPNTNKKYGWSFIANGVDDYHGCIGSAEIQDGGGGAKALLIEGQDSVGNLFGIIIGFTSTLQPGTYTSNQGSGVVFQTANNSYLPGGVPFSITVTTSNDTLVEGTFTGGITNVLDATDNMAITEGKFRALIGKANPCDGPTGPTEAEYILDCTDAAINGSYVKGEGLGTPNTVEIEVDVISPGQWAITTDQVNGIVFSGSGTFSASGLQRITLNAQGTPEEAGDIEIGVVGGGSDCVFSLTVAESSTPTCSLPNNTAELDGVASFSFSMVSGQTLNNRYVIEGNSANGDLKFEFFDAVQPAPGIYQITDAASMAQGKVLVSAVASTVSWQASTGVVFVTNVNGKINLVMCDIPMSGSLGGPTFNTLVSANLTEF